MRRPVLVLTCLFVLAGCGGDGDAPAAEIEGTASTTQSAPGSLRELDWLVGSWRGTGEGEEFFEDVVVEDDSTLAIIYYEDGTRTATQRIRGTIELRDGAIWHTYGDARWRASQVTQASLGFVPVENATNQFTWTRESNDRWIAVLRYPDPDGGYVEGTYVMQRN